MDKLFESIGNILERLDPATGILVSVLGYLVYSCTNSTKQSLDNNTRAINDIKGALEWLKAKVDK